MPIFLEYRNGLVKPPSPMKFNKTWIKDESFRQLILSHWVSFDPDNRLTSAYQFVVNFHKIKGHIKRWAADKRSRE